MAASVLSVTPGSDDFDDITLTKPSGMATDGTCRLVAICFRDEGHATPSWVSNLFTKLGELNVAGRGIAQVWQRVVGGSEPSSYTYVEPSNNSTGTVHLFAVSNVDPSMTIVVAFDQGTSSVSVTAPSILAASYTGRDPLLLTGHYAWSEGTSRTWTVPSGMTTCGGIDPPAHYVQTFAARLGLSGTVATGARTATVSGAEPWLSVSVAIPAPAAAAVTITDTDPALITVSNPGPATVVALTDFVNLADDAPAPAVVSDPGAGTVGIDITDTAPAAAFSSDPGVATVAVSVDDPRPALVVLSDPGSADVIAEELLLPDAGRVAVAFYLVDPTTDELTPLPHVTDYDLSPIQNSAGTVTLTYPKAGLNSDLLWPLVDDDVQIELEIWIGNRSSGALRALFAEGDTDDASETPSIKIGGQFLEVILDGFTTRWQPPPPTPAPTEEDPEPKAPEDNGDTIFDAVTPGAFVGTLMAAAQTYGAVAGQAALTWDTFTATHDSAGNEWTEVITGHFAAGSAYLSLLQQMADDAVFEFEVTPQRQLKLYTYGSRGRDRTVGLHPTTLRRGQHFTEVNRKRTSKDALTDIEVYGKDGLRSTVFDPDARTRYGRRIMGSLSAGEIDVQGALDAYAQQALLLARTGTLEITAGLVYGSGRPIPVNGFHVGDLLGFDFGLGTQDRPAIESYRVVQWSLSQSGNDQSGTITVNDLISDQLSKLRKRFDRMQRGTTVIGSSQSVPPVVDTVAPATPTGLVVGSFAYQDGTNSVTSATLEIGYNAVTLNMDGTACTDLAGYQAQYRYLGLIATGVRGEPGEWFPPGGGPTEWNFAPTTTAPSQLLIHEDGLGTGFAVEVQVRAFDNADIRNYSPWSTGVTLTTAVDDLAPPTPSAPTQAAWFKTINVSWDGTDNLGEQMIVEAPDFNHVEVHMSTANNFTPDPSTFRARLYAAGTWNETDWPYGVAAYARLVAVDNAGNPSGVSNTSAPVTVEQLVNIDIGPNAIAREQIIDGEIVRAKIGDAQINSAKISDVDVGLLTAGTMTATITNSGLIRTAVSGTRVEFDAAGLRMYNGATLIGNWKTSDASMLMTGTYRSGLTGERINILSDGTMRLYPSAGTNFAVFANNADAGEVYVRGPVNGSNQAGTSFWWPSGVGLGFGVYPSAIATDLTSRLSVGDRLISQQGALLVNTIDGRFSPADGTARRVLWAMTNSSGVAISNGYMHWDLTGTAGGSNCPHIYGANTNTGIRLADALRVEDNSGNPKGVYSSNFQTISEISAKTNIGVVEVGRGALSALDLVRAARARKWQYRFELEPRPDQPGTRLHRLDNGVLVDAGEAGWAFPQQQAPWHVGPMADDLDVVAPELVMRDPRGIRSLDVAMVAGVAWSAAAQAGDQLLRLAAEVDRLRRRIDGEPQVVDGEVA